MFELELDYLSTKQARQGFERHFSASFLAETARTGYVILTTGYQVHLSPFFQTSPKHAVQNTTSVNADISVGRLKAQADSSNSSNADCPASQVPRVENRFYFEEEAKDSDTRRSCLLPNPRDCGPRA